MLKFFQNYNCILSTRNEIQSDLRLVKKYMMTLFNFSKTFHWLYFINQTSTVIYIRQHPLFWYGISISGPSKFPLEISLSTKCVKSYIKLELQFNVSLFGSYKYLTF